MKTKSLLFRCYLPAMKAFSVTLNGAVPTNTKVNTTFVDSVINALPTGLTATAQRPGSITG